MRHIEFWRTTGQLLGGCHQVRPPVLHQRPAPRLDQHPATRLDRSEQQGPIADEGLGRVAFLYDWTDNACAGPHFTRN